MSQNQTQEVQVTNIDVPFLRMVWLLIKLAIAAVPAMIIVAIFWTMIAGLFGGMMH
ncbi:MAG: hypothetical protein RI556_12775 [Hydrogenovibrio sp.]|uniref:hypothetical protein n=1 Tax=Hydrogenovibrio sp. TaxID=2065821 RepID=UPI00286FC6F1|nr:hypothetical protein [Hydrogenovibrio sp.]MDR9500043.1 hypothetical protein [Hydrogenovibrio sp.]